MGRRSLLCLVLAALLLVGEPASAHSAAVATVSTAGVPLNVRSGGSTLHPILRTVPHGARLTVVCQIWGQLITGTGGRRTTNWDRLSTGGFVSDAFLVWRPARPALPWCGYPPNGPTTPSVFTKGAPLNLRTGPSTTTRIVGTVRDGTRLAVVCYAYGQGIAGAVRTSPVWSRLSNGRYVSDAYVAWRPSRAFLPWCGQAPPDVPSSTSDGFIAWAAGPARASMEQYRVPASVTIAQAILESGWGRSGLNRLDHNYFGMKCFGGTGGIAIGCRSYPTYECGGSGCYLTSAEFRAYRTATYSFVDHGRALATLPRYRAAFAYTKDPNRFAIAIHQAGYATAPDYAQKLIGLMRQFNLYRYDR